MGKIVSRYGKYLAVLGIVILVFAFNKTIKKVPLLADDNTKFVKARVVEKDNLQAGSDSSDGGQKVTLLITSGEHKGEYVEAYSLNGYLYGADCKIGTKVIANISEHDGVLTANVYNYDRELPVALLLCAFAAVMWMVGGKRGINSLIALIFTFIVVIFLYVPMMYAGVSPFLAAIITVIMVTVVTHILIADFELKSIAAMAGTIAGVVIAGLIAVVFGKTSHITGMNVNEIETLMYVGQNSKLDIGGMLFSGILISSMGAVMDVAMSVSSAIAEIHDKSKTLGMKELFISGMHVGKDMMGTMSNTLILAFAGGSISVLVLDYAYNLPLRQIINSYSIGIEIMQGIAGSIGVILTVPTTAFMAALLYGAKRNITVHSSQEDTQ